MAAGRRVPGLHATMADMDSSRTPESVVDHTPPPAELPDRDSSTHRRPTPRWLAPLALFIDVALVIGFVAVGQREHDSAAGLLGLLATAAPFVIALLLTTAATGGLSLRHRSWTRIWPHGVIVWAGTLALGMSLRVILGLGGAPLAFIIVAAASLALVLLGRRLITAWMTR